MAVMNGYTATPHHRQNRRRERPGSRTRRTITRKANIQYDCNEGLLDARDPTVPLPSDKTRRASCLCLNYDKSWEQWKARQAKEQALAGMDKLHPGHQLRHLESDEVDDDELYRMGILYNDEDDIAPNSNSKTISWDVPLEHPPPLFVFRPGKTRRSRRSSTLQSLPLYLSFAELSEDADIAHLLSSPTSNNPNFQHRIVIRSPPATMDIPQSLPPTPALEFVPESASLSDNNTISLPLDLHSVDWTLVTPQSALDTPTPLSEPEAEWILIDDS